MARTGVYFSDVKQARDALVAQGRHPSIDAVRMALGNTGSKTTIHKYLREIEEQESGRQGDVSDAIGELVAKLAAQLKQEAALEVESMRAQLAGQEALHSHALDELRAELTDTQHTLAASHAHVDTISHELFQLREQLTGEQETRRAAELRNRALDERLQDAQRHQASLEEKHQHAREALSHYRAAVQEQREQETQRHEAQVQGLQVELRQAQLAQAQKNEELTRLNREAAALATELGSTRQALHQEQATLRQQMQRLEQLQVEATRAQVLEARLADNAATVTRLEAALERSGEKVDELHRQNGVAEARLASAVETLAQEQRIRQELELEQKLAALAQLEAKPADKAAGS